MTTIHPVSPAMHKDILRLVEGIRKLIDVPTAWTKGVLARNKHNQVVIPFDNEARCWDIVGAISCCAHNARLFHAQHMTIIYLRQFIDGKEIGRWQDEPKRTHQDVIDVLDKAITQLKQEISNA